MAPVELVVGFRISRAVAHEETFSLIYLETEVSARKLMVVLVRTSPS